MYHSPVIKQPELSQPRGRNLEYQRHTNDPPEPDD
jgi:hypothetical protein